MKINNTLTKFKNMRIRNSYRFGTQMIKPKASYSMRYTHGYIGSVIRVRRSSDNSEQDFLPSEIIDGTLVSFVGAGDGCIVTIYDQIGSNNVAQSDPNKQAKLVSNGTLILSNGKPAILSDGVDDFMQSSAGILPNDIDGFMNFTISKHVSGLAHVAIGDGGYTSSKNWEIIRVVSSMFRGDINFSPVYNDFGGVNRNITLQYIPSDILQHLHVHRFCGGDKVAYQIDNLTEVVDNFEIPALQNLNQELDFFAYDNLGAAISHGSIYWQETQIFDKYVDDVSTYKNDINSYYSIY